MERPSAVSFDMAGVGFPLSVAMGDPEGLERCEARKRQIAEKKHASCGL